MRREENAGYRHARLEECIQEELRALLRDDVADPALFAVRISALVLSVDYRHVRIHFALVESPHSLLQKRVQAEQALARATPFLRSQLAIALDLKRVPDLRFVFDGVVSLSEQEADPCE